MCETKNSLHYFNDSEEQVDLVEGDKIAYYDRHEKIIRIGKVEQVIEVNSIWKTEMQRHNPFLDVDQICKLYHVSFGDPSWGLRIRGLKCNTVKLDSDLAKELFSFE